MSRAEDLSKVYFRTTLLDFFGVTEMNDVKLSFFLTKVVHFLGRSLIFRWNFGVE